MQNKKLLITGSTSGIGLSFLTQFTDDYESIYAYGRNFALLDSLKHNAIIKKPIDFSFHSEDFDVSKMEQVDHVVLAAGIVENNLAGFYQASVTNSIVRVNLLSQINLLGELVREKRIKEGGSVVFVSSLLGPHIGMVGGAAYAASKAGLEGAAKVFALELSRKGVRVNTVSPGMVETRLTRDLKKISAKQLDADRAKYPLGKRFASPEEVNDVIRFLLSDDSKFVTGENIKIDGGYTVG